MTVQSIVTYIGAASFEPFGCDVAIVDVEVERDVVLKGWSLPMEISDGDVVPEGCWIFDALIVQSKVLVFRFDPSIGGRSGIALRVDVHGRGLGCMDRKGSPTSSIGFRCDESLWDGMEMFCGSQGSINDMDLSSTAVFGCRMSQHRKNM